MTINKTGFTSTHNRGFQMTFENGISISVQFGVGSYCDRRHLVGNALNSEMREPIVNSSNAEIAIWNADNEWFYFGSDHVKGWCTPDEVGRWINCIMKSTTLDDLHEFAVERGLIQS